jgi:hypothetical protein
MFEDTIKAIRQWFEPEPDLPDVDVEYIMSRNYVWLETKRDDESGELTARCDLCGKLFKIENTPQALEHIGEHERPSVEGIFEDGEIRRDPDPYATQAQRERSRDHSHLLEAADDQEARPAGDVLEDLSP